MLKAGQIISLNLKDINDFFFLDYFENFLGEKPVDNQLSYDGQEIIKVKTSTYFFKFAYNTSTVLMNLPVLLT